MSYILSYPKFVHKTFFVLFSNIYIYICLCFESELKKVFFFLNSISIPYIVASKITVQMNNSWHKNGKDGAAELDSNA